VSYFSAVVNLDASHTKPSTTRQQAHAGKGGRLHPCTGVLSGDPCQLKTLSLPIEHIYQQKNTANDSK